MPWAFYCKILAGPKDVIPASGTFSFFLCAGDVIQGQPPEKGQRDVEPFLCPFAACPPDEVVDWDSGRVVSSASR